MKIKCPLCGFENEEGSKFCKNCNEPLLKQEFSEDNTYIKKVKMKTSLLNIYQTKKTMRKKR